MVYEAKWNGLNTQAVSPAAWVLGAVWGGAVAEVVAAPALHMGRKPEAPPEREVVRVVELTPDEVARLWDAGPFVPPTDDDVFVRCQKIVIAYCAFYALNVDRAEYSLDHAYRQARKVARPLAALAAGIPLTKLELSEYAFWIYDSLGSWAPIEDVGAQTIRQLFAIYALPAEDADYRRVKA